MSLTNLNNNDIIFDASCTKYCVGPCTSKKIEKNNEFKPYNGGKYINCCYPLSKTHNLIIKNYRICSSCNKRYLENYDAEDYDTLTSDANIIRKKLGI